MSILIHGGRLPIHAWVADEESVEGGCAQQAINLANLPFAFHHIALMPDTHQGYGMPIGGVLATRGAVIPNAVGVDIGCGMAFVSTNVPASILREVETPCGSLGKELVSAIMREIPTGFGHHSKEQSCRALNDFAARHGDYENHPLWKEIHRGYFQVGTLGGGNHFIEFQEDESGCIGIMLHSGSRNFGKQICDYYNREAERLCRRWFHDGYAKMELAFLPFDDDSARAYLNWMELALDFARENRQAMLDTIMNIFEAKVETRAGISDIEFGSQINAHHNYAVMEHHYGENVLVHRKGAILAREGTMGIIPGAMGSYSYIVAGKGNPLSFNSASHGAGRIMGRKEATRRFTVQEVIRSLNQDGVILGKQQKDDVAEECKMAYKDIEEVIQNESDLVTPVKKLKTVCVIKG